MRKATKVLLLVGEITTFISVASWIIASILCIILGADVALLATYLDETEEAIKIIAPIYISLGIIFLIPFGIAIASGVLAHKARKQFEMGTTKEEMKKKAIMLIIFGALCNEILIVPAIFLLIIGPDKFNDDIIDVRG